MFLVLGFAVSSLQRRNSGASRSNSSSNLSTIFCICLESVVVGLSERTRSASSALMVLRQQGILNLRQMRSLPLKPGALRRSRRKLSDVERFD